MIRPHIHTALVSVGTVVLLIGSTGSLRAQDAVADTTTADSSRSRIIPGFGESTYAGGRPIAWRHEWIWTPARSVDQVVDRSPGQYLRTVGESGAWIGSSWLAGGSAHDAYLMDGLPAGDPLTGRVNLSLLPLEQLESIERLSDEGTTLTGHRWNLVTRQFSTVRPMTAIRFAQEPDETILSDGFFSQNIARSTALTVGFQRHTSAGRFANAALDAWDLRGRVRTNLSEWINVAVIWNHGRHTRGVNGGIDPAVSPSIFDEVSAIVVHRAGYEIYTRTDLGLTGVFRILDDSLSTTRISLLQRTAEREYRRFPDLYTATEERLFTRANDVRFSAEQRLQWPILSVAASAEFASTRIDTTEVYRQRDVTRSRWGATAALTLVDWLIPRGAVAVVQNEGDRALESALSLTVQPGLGLHAAASAQHLPVFPTLQERFWQDSTVLRPRALRRGEERLVTVELRWSLDPQLDIDVTGFRREQRDVIIARHSQTVHGSPSVAVTSWSPTWTGVAASARVRFFAFELSGSCTFVTVNVADTLKQILPQWWGTAEFAYHDRIFRKQLGLRAGIRTRFSDRLRGLAPDPPTGFEVATTTVQIGRAATVDVYGTMEIGQAFVTLAWENLTDAPTLRTALYPMPGRQFKLGVRWVFLD